MKKNKCLKILIVLTFMVVVIFSIRLIMDKNKNINIQEVKIKTEQSQNENDIQVDKIVKEENEDAYKDIKYISLGDLYDYDDDSSLKNGMWEQVEDESSEDEFVSFFFKEREKIEIKEYANAKILMGTVDDKNVFVALINKGDEEYPKNAYGFKYSMKDALVQGKYDYLKKD